MMRIIGITDEVNACQCCGRAGLKCTVVMESEDGTHRKFYGRQCAAKHIKGDKKAASVASVESLARGISYAEKWLGKTPAHAADVIANAIRVRFTACSAVMGSIEFPNGVIVHPQVTVD